MNCKTCGPDGCSDRVACPRGNDPKMAALRTAVMALAYAAKKLPEVQKAYEEVSAAIKSAVQQAAEAVGPDCVRAALRTDWSDPDARQPLTDDEVLARGPAGITKHSYLRGWRDAEQDFSLHPNVDPRSLEGVRFAERAHEIGSEGGAA